MAKLNWDVDGTRKFHAGVSHGVVYPKADGEGYDNGAAWNGLTGVTESPSGAEPTDLWADNMKYARLISGEDYGFPGKGAGTELLFKVTHLSLAFGARAETVTLIATFRCNKFNIVSLGNLAANLFQYPAGLLSSCHNQSALNCQSN